MNPKQIGIGILVLAIIGVAVYQFSNTGGQNQEVTSDTQLQVTQEATVPTTTAEQSNPAGETSMLASDYRDGTYEATGNYTSPAQEEEVAITITLENGVVTAATFDGKATNETSIKMQGLFSEGFEEDVVGKPINEINLTVVNGSSLTPKGFMDALEQVKTEAAV